MRGVLDIVIKGVRFEATDCHYLSPTIFTTCSLLSSRGYK
jgi:hypothetical protein